MHYGLVSQHELLERAYLLEDGHQYCHLWPLPNDRLDLKMWWSHAKYALVVS